MNKITALALAALFVFAAGCRKSGTTVASIGRDKISSAMLAERIQEAPPAYQSYLTTAAGKKQFLDLMVRERLVVEAARQAGISRKKEYTAAMAEFKKEQDRRMKDYEENLLMELYVKDLYSKEIGASDKEVNAYYTEHEDEFIHPREIMARHVLVPSREEAEKVAAA
jgi:hypothetical protein